MELSFLAKGLWAGKPWVELEGPSPTEEASATEVPLAWFALSPWAWSQPVYHLHPSYQCRCGGLFFKSLVYRFCSAIVQVNSKVECHISYL